jgi:hypothetical protein
LLNDRDVAQIFGHTFEHLYADVWMENLSAAEAEGELDLVTSQQELSGLFGLRVDVVVVCLGFETDFLQLYLLLVLAGFTLFFGLFIPKFAVVHDPTHWWDSIWRDFDQVESAVLGHLNSITDLDDADLVALFVNQSHFARTYAVIES